LDVGTTDDSVALSHGRSPDQIVVRIRKLTKAMVGPTYLRLHERILDRRSVAPKSWHRHGGRGE